MAATASTEARELSLLEKVELRIALTDTDAKLQSSLNTYLTPVLLKLASEHSSVRNKVISICQQINTRVKPENIQLPIAALLAQLKEHRQIPLIRHFDLLYIQQGISRLSTSQLAELFPVLVRGISADGTVSPQHGAIVFHLLLRSLLAYKLPLRGNQEDSSLRKTLGITDEDGQFLSEWFTKLFLFRPISARSPAGPIPPTSRPGLSQEEYQFLALHGKPDAWNPNKNSGLNVTEAKSKALALLTTGLFNDSERFLPVLFASADPVSRISESADDVLKRTVTQVSFEDGSLVSRLWSFCWWPASSNGQGAATTPPVRVPVRTKVMNILSKSMESTKFTETIVHIVQRDLVNGGNSPDEGESFSQSDREIIKLQGAIVSYLMFVARRATKSDLHKLALPLIQQLKSWSEEQGSMTSTSEIKSLRCSTYEIIGQMAGSDGLVLMQPDQQLLKWLFQSLSEERDRDVLISIDEALASAMRCIQGIQDFNVESALRPILLAAMTEETTNKRNMRFAAVRFANRCLAYSDITARSIDMLALCDPTESHETVEEAKKGLDPYWYGLSHSFDENIPTSRHGGTLPNDKDNLRRAARSKFAPFTELVKHMLEPTSTPNPMLRSLVVSYCRKALVWECLAAQQYSVGLDSEWERKLDLAASQDQIGRQAIRRQLNTMAGLPDSFKALNILWQSAVEGMAYEHTASRMSCARVFHELCVLSPEPMLKRWCTDFAFLQPAIFGNDTELRCLAGQAYGILASHLEINPSTLADSLNSLLETMKTWKGAAGGHANKVHGAILSLASFISHRTYRAKNDTLCSKILSQFLPTLLQILDETTDTQMSQASLTSLGQLCCFYVISMEQISAHMPYQKVLERVLKYAKAGNETAILALGHSSMILQPDHDDEMMGSVFEKLRNLHDVKQAETQFAVGEALTCFACGWQSQALTLDIDGPPPVGSSRTRTSVMVLDRMLTDARTTKPSLKKASTIWLLSFVQYCAHLPEVQDQLRHIQALFRSCLSDRDELVQEVASRGLGLVYEKGSKDIRDTLIRDLVSSFSSDRAQISGTISSDTELFEPGALPTGEGSSVTTYKDIMSLASEVGDSSLTYRFMALASNNAIWSSRAAFGRFGLSNVLSESGYLADNPKLYPKLFRYRFDPNTNVRRSMNDIWNALVKDSIATIDVHFNAIMDDLLRNMVTKEWRTRQASCAAIADLVQGRDLNVIKPYLERLWTLCFKVLDDIKESVRTAAAGLSRILVGTLIRSLEVPEGSSKDATAMLRSVLPFLLSTTGVESSAKEVQTISLHSVLEIIKKARGPVLRPFLPELVESLLSLLTSLEPQAINYIHLNADKHGLTEKAIDQAREASVRGSPLMDAIERCLDLVDEETMNQLSSSLRKAMQSAVGMPSKVGCSRVLVSLATRKNVLFRPYADQFLKTIQKHISDRNEAVSSAYATAMGYVARVSSDQAILESASRAKTLYLEAEDVRQRIMAAEMVRAVGKYATDRFAALASAFLPFVYIGRLDADEQVSQIFRQIWDDNTGGPRAVSLYLGEIIKLAEDKLTSPRWTLKHAAALSIAEATIAVAATQGRVNGTAGELLWPALEKALAEKSWAGKEEVLKGFVAFVKGGDQFWGARLRVREAIQKIAKREANRRNADYRPFAITTLGEVAEALNDDGFADAAVGIVQAVVEEALTAANEGDVGKVAPASVAAGRKQASEATGGTEGDEA